METDQELAKKKAASNEKVEKKRSRSEKRRSTVHFPDWRITNGQSRTTQLIISYKEGKQISKLREPRNLYALPNKRHYSNINIPRWPMELKVLKQHPRHQNYVPLYPEMFYNTDLDKDGVDNFSVLMNIKDGKLVYENAIGQSKYFDYAQVGGNAIKAKPNNSLKLTNDSKTLRFESRFESGNLLKAVKVGPYDYQLWLRTDLYTKKYTQWYYFRVENTLPETTYRFTIMNLMKSSSLYSNGMKPLMYSEQEAKENGIGWRRVGMNIKYYKNDLKQDDLKREKCFYSLSWTVHFPYAADRCYFAHCYPYTYTDLQEYLRKLSRDPGRSHYCKQKMLTRSLAGNFVYIITITSPSKCPADAKSKRAIVVTARVHPGETNSSWMMKGLLDYLTSEKPDAKLLRDTFVFKIIPMLNPDGVIVGNYRCSLSGRDLNRNYKTAMKDAFPSVFHTREMVKRLFEEREVTLYCDLHGHSRQQNVFIYGCEDRRDISSGFSGRVFPMMLSKNCKDKFCFNRCKFKVQKSKTGTGRVVMWNLGIKNSYTLEATFCGSTLGSKSGQHFTTADYEAMGYHLCDTLLDYCDPDVSKYLSVLKELEIFIKALILERMKERGIATADMDPGDVDLDKDYTSELESSTSGSDSSVSDGLPMHVLYPKREKKMKKHLKTRKERNRRRERTMVKQNNSSVNQKEGSLPTAPVESDVGSSKTRRKSTNSSSEQTKHSVSHYKPSKTPNNNENKMTKDVTAVHRVDNIKVHRYLESIPGAYSKNGVDVSSNKRVGMPGLRYTSGKAYFGLAPETSTYSLQRWSVRRNSTADEEEQSFIGRYVARQIKRSQPVTYSDCESNNDKSTLKKIQLYNESFKVLAAAQDVDNRDHKDHKDNKDNKGPMEKYCAHHAAMQWKEKDEQETGSERSFVYLGLNKGSSSEQLSSSYEKTSSKNVRQLPMSSTTVLSGVKLPDDNKDDEKKPPPCYIKGQLMVSSKTAGSFPSLHKAQRLDSTNEKIKKTFNFRGVPEYPNYNTNHLHTQYDKDITFVKTASSSSSSDYSSKRLMEKQHPDKGFLGDPPSNVKNSLTENEAAKRRDEPSLETVNRLRERFKNLNASGRMVTFALNNQLNDMEEVLQKSLVEDFIDDQEERDNISQASSTMKERESIINNRQGKPHVVSPNLWECGGKMDTEKKQKPKKSLEAKKKNKNIERTFAHNT